MLLDFAAEMDRKPVHQDDVPPAAEPAGAPRRVRRRKGRRNLANFENIPVTTHVHELSAEERACPCCGAERKEIGADENWQIEYYPGHFERIQHLRKKYACPACETNGDGAQIQAAAKPTARYRRSPAAGLYARVSTNDQQTLAMQNRAMREYVERRGWTIALQIREVGSGAAKREAREKLLEAARRREIDLVLVWRLDRWGRSVTESAGHSFRNWSIWVSVRFSDRGAGPDHAIRPRHGRPAGIFAEFEREILRERTRAGLAHARQNGKRLAGLPPRPLTLPRCGNCSAPASANLQSPAGLRSGAPRCAAF